MSPDALNLDLHNKGKTEECSTTKLSDYHRQYRRMINHSEMLSDYQQKTEGLLPGLKQAGGIINN